LMGHSADPRESSRLRVTSLTMGSTTRYAISFTFVSADASLCGPGTYSLTQVVLAVSRVSAQASSISIQLYSAASSSGIPLSSGLSQTIFNVPLPSSPGYVALPLSALSIDAASSSTRAFSIAVSGFPAFNLHSVDSSGDFGRPANGTGSAFASFTSANSGSTWIAQDAYRGVTLSAIQQTCAPSASQTASATGTQSQSATQTVSPEPIREHRALRRLEQTRSRSLPAPRRLSQSGTRSQSCNGHFHDEACLVLKVVQRRQLPPKL